MKDIYGSAILFFYFLKWPIVVGLPLLYYGYGLKNNWPMNLLWLFCLALIFKDIYTLLKSRKRE
ncbi:MAG: hypothetical protein B5M52_07505 [Helicobacteraceae bacterium 4484_230]|nr:MAG: hypothetical protein B5M52_07505 [Helicobacteraceae bacterium 4484_230]